MNKPSPQTIPDSLIPFRTGNSIIVRSPGRINLIGEHTDYNNGFVLPAAIDKNAWICLTPRKDDLIELYSADLKDSYQSPAKELIRSENKNWPNYLLGVVDEFQRTGIPVPGFKAVLTSDVPIGSGLSSSAAIECSMAMALNQLTNAGLSKLELVTISQKAENNFVGMQCGIMDQFASMFGKSEHVIRLDCETLDYQYVPFHMKEIRIVLLDTNVKHSLASSEYNVRRKECEQGVEWVAEHVQGIKSLRQVTIPMLDEFVRAKNELIYNRCKFVVEENIRLLTACDDLAKDDLHSFGLKMFETHNGLSRLYEVSCKELDFLVAAVTNNKAVLGARMMGGGFGGCTINLVKEDAIPDLISNMTITYQQKMNRKLQAYVARIGEGTAIIS